MGSTGTHVWSRTSRGLGMDMRAVSVGALALFGLLCFGTVAQGKLVWDEIDYADTNIEKHRVLASPIVMIDGHEMHAGYKPVIRSGAEDPKGSGGVLGRVFDKDGKPLDEINIVPSQREVRNGRNESVVDISHDPDFVSILTAGDKLFMLAHFESPNPGSSYLIEVSQDKKGELSAVGFEAVDWSSYGGLWVPCAGSVTPWGTHLGSEEYPPDARQIDVKEMEEWEISRNNSENSTPRKVEEMMRYFGVYPDELTPEALKDFKPYLYGYPWEVAVKEDGTYTNVKHMVMGRTAVELPYVMPDDKTVYITDDGLNRVFTMFVSDKPKDLSCGKLYAAKADQVDSDGGGIFNIEWIELGESACNKDLREKAEELRFADIFEVAAPKNTTNMKKMCEDGFTAVNVDIAWECLKVKEGMETYASRFETRRYAGMLGATTEWNKWEGITFSPRRRKIYTALSAIEKGMEDFARKGEKNDKYDIGGGNHIRLGYNRCGCVYVMDIDEKYWANNMYPLTCGTPIEGDPENKCDLDGISNPDNVVMIEEHDGLLIGEDTSNHRNDVVWYMDLKTGDMTRIFSTPYGAETTGPYWHPDINGWSYMMVVVQHPYGESDQDKRFESDATGIQGWIGYVGPFDAKLSAE